MTVQASAVRRLLTPEQEREREALLVVEQTGREALAEMRRLVGVLRRPEEAPALVPQPSLEHVKKLVEQTREAGLPTQLNVEGDASPLPAGIDLTAYRLVQEGLTNALKHANATQAEVLVRYEADAVELVVRDNGTGGGNGGGSGHGLVGMRERVSVCGGKLEAGPTAARRLRAARAPAGHVLRERPCPDRRRPGARPDGLSHDPRGRARHRGRRARPATAPRRSRRRSGSSRTSS